MNITVIGLGSMGKRRIYLLREMYPEFTVYGVDSRSDRVKETEEAFHIKCFSEISEIPVNCDCVFVCTSPLSHASIISDCLSKGWHVFTEMNLVDYGYDDNIQLAEEKKRVLFLSSTFLYRDEIKYIQSRIVSGRIWNYVYHIGQYLPDWHSWENYKDYFVGDSRTNGCREILAIELPWLIASFGDIEQTIVQSDKMSDLEIEYSDNYMIQILHVNGNKGSLIVDVVSPCAVRKFEAYAEGQYVSWGGTPDSLMEYNSTTGEPEKVSFMEEAVHKEGYRSFIVENAYRNEIRAFFDVVREKKEPIYGLEQDRKVLRWIDSIGA